MAHPVDLGCVRKALLVPLQLRLERNKEIILLSHKKLEDKFENEMSHREKSDIVHTEYTQKSEFKRPLP